ncbi:MAG: hypothetical protein H7210_04345 [Pyrinomonadaceae bacterium]|nr:hypothetical protein [Phycisphaerales bacterium]
MSDEHIDAGQILRNGGRPYVFVDVAEDADAVRRLPDLLRWHSFKKIA